MNLYRIISLETFIDLLHNKRERYVRPETWDDNYEGYLFGKIENSKDRRKIIEDVYYNVCPRNYTATINNLLKLEHGKYFVYGQCWSTLSDSDALWRIYSYSHHAIQIKTTDVRIKNLLKTKADILYEIRKVKVDRHRGIQCLSTAKKYKLYKSSINKSIHFVQRNLSSSTRVQVQRVTAQLNLSRE